MLGHLLLPEIEEMIKSGDFAGLRDALSDFLPPDLAELLADLPPGDTAVIFRILPRKLAAETFEYLNIDTQEVLLKALGQEQVADLLNAMAPDDRTALLEELPGEVTRRLLALLSPEELATAKKLLGYPEESIGRRMTPDYVSIREDWTVGQVLDHVRKNGRNSETLNVLYVVDERGHLIDDVKVREFLLAPLEKKVSELLDDEFISLKATDDQEKAVAAFRKYDMVALPVTDSAGLLVGILTVDDVLDVAEQEATEDIQKLGGMEALDEPYMQIAFQRMLKKRAGWLVILFMGEMLTATAMAFYEEHLAKVLVLFLPLLISCGGNSGSQAATLVIRALALGEVKLRDWWRIMRREFYSGLAMGAILGILGYARIAIWHAATNGKAYGQHWHLIGLTIMISLVGIVMLGTLAGSMLPLIMKRLGADPATSSAPFVATLVDVAGVVIYFSVAAALLRGVLL